MSETLARNPSSPARIDIRFARLMGHLETDYQHMRPQFEAGGFRRRVYESLSKQLRADATRLMNPGDELDIGKIHSFVCGIELDALPVPVALWIIYAGCAYCIVAQMAYENNEVDRAWDMLTEAAVRVGWLQLVNYGPEIYDHELLKAVKAESGRKASDGRHRRTREMKEAAYAHVRENGGFPSQGRAVISIESMLREKFPAETPLKDPKTIPRWLKEMPGREELFDTLKKRKK